MEESDIGRLTYEFQHSAAFFVSQVRNGAGRYAAE
jgi:hypothetical protein